MGDNKRPRAALRMKSRHMRMDNAANDEISKLTNDVLLIILSFLTVKDAVITSMVNRNFRHLWRFNNRCLNLEIPERTKMAVRSNCWNFARLFDSKILKHTDRINRTLELHSSPHLDEIRIGTYGHACSPTHILSWINFAIQKGVKVFELKLGHSGSVIQCPQHSFPGIETLVNLSEKSTWEEWLHHVLEDGKSTLEERLHRRRENLEKHQLRSFCCLKSLSLGFIDVGEEIIYYFLSNCMFLEQLRVEQSRALLNLKVADGLRLNCLEIIRCLFLQSLKIYSKNLVSLVYIGPKIDVPFQNVPCNLLELTIGDEYGASFAFEHDKYMTYLCQLERLKFKVNSKLHASICRDPPILFPMINLRHLELQVPIGKSLMGYIVFLNASPFLSTFKMEYHLSGYIFGTKAEFEEWQAVDKLHEARKVPHHHLQTVELIGFNNERTNIGFALHLISMAVCLKKMILKFPYYLENLEAFCNVDKELRHMLPSGAELVLENISL